MMPRNVICLAVLAICVCCCISSCTEKKEENEQEIKRLNEKIAALKEKKEQERARREEQERIKQEQAQIEEEERKQAAIEAEAKKCYQFNKEKDHLIIECSTAEAAEKALFLGLIEWHKNFNPWGGTPVIKKDSTLMTPDGKSMKVKYFLVQLDKFGEERGEGSSWLMGQTFELEDGKWSTGVQLMQTMHY